MLHSNSSSPHSATGYSKVPVSSGAHPPLRVFLRIYIQMFKKGNFLFLEGNSLIHPFICISRSSRGLWDLFGGISSPQLQKWWGLANQERLAAVSEEQAVGKAGAWEFLVGV